MSYGSNTYGSATLGGIAKGLLVFVASGGLSLGGSADVWMSPIQGEGGTALGGSADVWLSPIEASGGVKLGGAADVWLSPIEASGGVRLGGRGLEGDLFDLEFEIGGPGFVLDDLVLAQRVDYDVDANKLQIYRVEGKVVAIDREGEATVQILSGKAGIEKFGDGIEFARVGNPTDPSRQGSIYLTSVDDGGPFIDVIDEVKSFNAADPNGLGHLNTIKVRLGRLSGITDPDFGGALSGYGLYTRNAYLKGNLVVKSSTGLALINDSIMVGNISGAAQRAIKLANTGVATSSGLFGYDANAQEIFSLRLDGTLSLKGVLVALTGSSIPGGVIVDGSVIASKLTENAKDFITNIVFSSTLHNRVDWTSGTIKFADGSSSGTIVAGNTGPMTAMTYIYYDAAVSTTALQTTTNFANAVGERKVLLCVADPFLAGGQNAFFIPAVGLFGLNEKAVSPNTISAAMIKAEAIQAGHIAALAIQTGHLAAGSVTAAKINVAQLSAISANLGSITAGTITGVTITGSLIRTAASGVRIELRGSDNTLEFFSATASAGRMYGAVIGGVSVIFAQGSFEVTSNLDLGDAGGNFGGQLRLHNGTFGPIQSYMANLYCRNDADVLRTDNQFEIGVAAGVAPLAVSSSTLCVFLNADLLDGQHGSYYQNASNLNAGIVSTDRFSAYSDLVAEAKIGSGAAQVAAGNHLHDGRYVRNDSLSIIRASDGLDYFFNGSSWVPL